MSGRRIRAGMDTNRIATAAAFWVWMVVVAGFVVVQVVPTGAVVVPIVAFVGIGLVSHRVVYGGWWPFSLSTRLLGEPDPYGTADSE